MLSEFRAFIARGSVLDLAVGVIIGAAFGKIVASLTDDILMPVIGTVFGGMDFTNKFMMLGAVPADYTGSLSDYAALKAAGVPLLGYGSFVTALINFVIMALVIFLIIRQANKVLAAPTSAGPSEVDLLTEIRDVLKKS